MRNPKPKTQKLHQGYGAGHKSPKSASQNDFPQNPFRKPSLA